MTGHFSDVWSFVVKVLHEWLLLLLGGLLAVITIIALKRQRQIAWLTAVIIFTLAVLPAAYKAWHREYSALRDLKEEHEQLKAMAAPCPPAKIVPVRPARWYTLSVGHYLRLSEALTQLQSEAALDAIVAVKVFVNSGLVRYSDTGESPGLYRGETFAAGVTKWICPPLISTSIFRGAENNSSDVQVTIYRIP
jgi:hypothetical protein